MLHMPRRQLEFSWKFYIENASKKYGKQFIGFYLIIGKKNVLEFNFKISKVLIFLL